MGELLGSIAFSLIVIAVIAGAWAWISTLFRKGIMALIGFHLYLVVRLGVTSPPWSADAAGRERVEAPPATNGRSGLVRPGPRGRNGK